MLDQVGLFLSLFVLAWEQYHIVLEVILDANTVLHPFHGGLVPGPSVDARILGCSGPLVKMT